MARDEKMYRSEAMYRSEHSLSWLMAAGSIVLGIVGSLVAFGVISLRDAAAASAEAEAARNFQDGLMIILPGIAAAFLALTLHTTDHHLRGAGQAEGMLAAEHGLAYLTAVVTVGLAIIGVLVGFGAFDNANGFRDGAVWQLLAIQSGILAATLHAVRHHVAEYDVDDIRVIVEERVRSAMGRPDRTAAERGYENI